MKALLMKFILFLILSEPGGQKNELVKDADLLAAVAGHTLDAAQQYKQEAHHVAYWIFMESRWQHDAVGTIPNKDGKVLHEKGYAQAHGLAKKTCEAHGLDITTRKGGIHCVALLLDMGTRYCGSLHGGSNWYASGKCRSTPKTWKKMGNRLKAADRKWAKVRREEKDE